MSVRVNADNFETEVLKSEIPVIADFYSDSCVPCKRMSPVLAEIEEENAGEIKVAKININFDGELAEKYEVQAAPTFVFFKNGEESARIRGAAKKAEIIETINSLK
jgi:thioredoxin 1